MTISATSQGLKPGVCTSSNRPANPYVGMVIFETDTGLTQIWDGSAWKPVTTTSLTAASGYLRYQTSWTNVTYNTGWGVYDASTWGQGQYYRTVDGMVHLRGLVKRSSGSSATIFNLPSGYRPPTSCMGLVNGSGGILRIDIVTSGDVNISSSASGSVNVADWISLNEIKFSVF